MSGPVRTPQEVGLFVILLFAIGGCAPRDTVVTQKADLERMAAGLKTNEIPLPRERAALHPSYIFWVDKERSRKTTVEATLIDLRASLRDGKVVDSAGDELYFYAVQDHYHSKFPGPRQNTEEEIKDLEKEYRVIRMYGPAPKE